MSYAMPDNEFRDDDARSAGGILEHCQGLPIALAVAAVAVLVNLGLPFRTACEKYLEHEMHTGLSVLDAAISSSLDFLEDCASNDGNLISPYTCVKCT